MQTQCPQCHTAFRITATELQAARGQVRCGLCSTIFQAVEVNRASHATRAADHSLVPAVIESGPPTAALPAYRFESEPQPPGIPDLVPDLVEAPECEDAPEADPGHEILGPPVPDLLDQELGDGPVVLEPRPRSRFFAVGVALLALLLAGQYVYYHRATLSRNPLWAGALEWACPVVGCRVDPPRDLEAIKVVRRNIHSHPRVGEALVISAALVNTADHAQPYPDLQVALSDLQGRVLAARRFRPSEYLAEPRSAASLMAPHQKAEVHLEIRDPGAEVMAFELALL